MPYPADPPSAAPTTPAAPVTQALADAARQPQMLDTLLSNPLQAWLVAGGTLLALILLFFLLRALLTGRLEKIASRTETHWDDVFVAALKRIRFWLIFPALLYGSIHALALPVSLEKALKIVAMLGVGVQLLISARHLVDAGFEVMVKRSRTDDPEHDATIASSLGVVRVIVVGLIAILVVLFALDNLGIAVTPMLTGLGIGGIAVALAVQNILGDLFGSLTIILDKPFVVGDAITVGDKSGTVEHIGIKTTRVRAQSGEQLVFANSDLLTSRVQNFKRMKERRVSFLVTVVFDTPPDKLARVPAAIRSAIEEHPDLRFDRAHLRSFGQLGHEFEAVYFVLSSDYNQYMDAQQAINLAIIRVFAKEDIDFSAAGQPFSRPRPASK